MGERENIFLVEDSDIYRESLSMILKSRKHNVVGTAGSIEDVIVKLQNPDLKFRIAVIDANVPNVGDGEIAAKLIREKRPEVVIFSHAGDPQSWGDKDIPKGGGPQSILDAISNA